MEVCAQVGSGICEGGAQLHEGRVTINPASATNTVPSPASADVASKGLAIFAQGKGCARKATNDKCVSSGRCARVCCAIEVRKRHASSDASAVFIAINARLRATL